MGEEIKDQKITIRVSPTEKKDIETKAEQAKMSMSRYLVAATENKKIRVTEKIPDLYLEITRIGVNINQIAHVANSQKYVNTQQIYEVKKLLREVNANMEKVVKTFEDDDDKDIQTKYASENKLDFSSMFYSVKEYYCTCLQALWKCPFKIVCNPSKMPRIRRKRAQEYNYTPKP